MVWASRRTSGPNEDAREFVQPSFSGADVLWHVACTSTTRSGTGTSTGRENPYQQADIYASAVLTSTHKSIRGAHPSTARSEHGNQAQDKQTDQGVYDLQTSRAHTQPHTQPQGISTYAATALSTLA